MLSGHIARGQKTFGIEVATGYGTAGLNWSIAGANQFPNVLSELNWNGLRGTGFGLSLTANLSSRLRAEVQLAGLSVRRGSVRDIDYAWDNRQDATYDEYFDARNSSFWGIEWILGYRLWQNSGFFVSLLAGGFLQHSKTMLLPNDLSTAKQGLSSWYKTDGVGGLLGLSVGKRTGKVGLTAKGTVGILDFNATAGWNLKTQFKQPISFRHDANGWRYSLEGEVKYWLTDQMAFGARADVLWFRINQGVDKAFYVNRPAIKTQFNGAELDMVRYVFSYSYLF